MMDYRTFFNKEEWDLLRAAPFNVQVLVSQADQDRELDEIGPLLDVLMTYSGDPFVEEVFRDTLEATEESRLEVEPREALNQVSQAVQLIKNNIANNNIAKNNITGYDSTLDNTSLDIAFNSQTHDLNENTNNYSNLSNYDNSLDFVQDKANNRIDNMINQMSTTCPNQNEDIQTLANEVYIKKAIDELNLPQTMVYKINDVSYINSINISSVDEKNNNQIGVWYTAPATFLKITKTSAKLYIYTKAKIIVPAIIDYKPIFSGGLFISPNFQNYKNNLIEFKYNKDKDQMILKYKNVNTGNNHALNMIKLSPGLCSKVVHKIRDRDAISVKTSNLLLELLDDN